MGETPAVLVTGGAGFVGATLVRRLLGAGRRVRVLDDFSTGDPGHLAGLEAEIVRGDVRDRATLEGALSGVSEVVHLAAAGSVVGSVADPEPNFDVNVAGTFRLLDAARRAGVARLVHASTGGALFGRHAPPVDESTPPSPISPYGASKLAGEGYAQAFAGSYGLPAVVLRFGNVYGPWSARKNGAVAEFLRAIRDGRPMVVYGDGGASRDFVHVDDIARAVELSLGAELEPGCLMHLASGRETTVAELVSVCRAAAGSPDHPVELRPSRRGEVVRTFSSYRLAARLIGFAPEVTLEDGVARTWEWLFAAAS